MKEKIETFGNGNDAIVIRQDLGGIPKGCVLDLTDYDHDEIRVGQFIMRSTATDEKVVYKPVPVTGAPYSENATYGNVPSGYEICGCSRTTRLADEPEIGIMNRGVVNDVAGPFVLSAQFKALVKAALPALYFDHD